jgi:hypothetical protein
MGATQVKNAPLQVLAALAMAAWTAAPAHAVMVANLPHPVPARETPRVVPTAPAAPTLELIAGTISAVDSKARTVTVAGSALSLHPTQLRVFAPNGVRMGESDLAPGMRVRFAVAKDPRAKAASVVVLIYVDARA